MPNPRIGSLFSGYGGLDMAVEAVTGGTTVWRSDIKPAAVTLIAHRWPDVRNIGDITKVDWSTVEPVDVITGGFPCTDISAAGKQAGLIRRGENKTRSGLWAEMCEAINLMRPALVVAENVRALTYAKADSDVELCPWCVGNPDGPALRALGAVLGDLADIGYDAAWFGLRAADVGACHGRFRVFIVAWPATNTGPVGRDRGQGVVGGRGDATERGETGDHVGDAGGAAADSGGEEQSRRAGLRPDGTGRLRRARSGDSAVSAPADDDCSGCGGVGWIDTAERHPDGRSGSDADGHPAEPASADADSTVGSQLPGVGDDQRSVADAQGYGWDEGWTESAGSSGGSDAAVGGVPVEWGKYGPAIRQWEQLTRPAPAPTITGPKGGQQLSPYFTEWIMGLPAGHITDVPGLTRSDMLSLCGDGVVPQQAEAAIRHLLEVIPR